MFCNKKCLTKHTDLYIKQKYQLISQCDTVKWSSPGSSGHVNLISTRHLSPNKLYKAHITPEMCKSFHAKYALTCYVSPQKTFMEIILQVLHEKIQRNSVWIDRIIASINMFLCIQSYRLLPAVVSTGS